MKKVLIVLALVVAFAGIGVTLPSNNVEAQEVMEGCTLVRALEYEGVGGGAGTTVTAADGDAWAIVCMINTVNRAAQVVFYLMMGIVVGLVTLGGAMILMGGQNPDNVDKGKKYITFGIAGVLVAVFAYAVPAIINLVIG